MASKAAISHGLTADLWDASIVTEEPEPVQTSMNLRVSVLLLHVYGAHNPVGRNIAHNLESPF